MHPDLGFDEARQFYHQVRRRAFERIRHSLVTRRVVDGSFAVRGLDVSAVEAWERTWRGSPHWSRRGGFQWALLHRRYCRKPRNFHCALWYGSELCGLAAGRLSESHGVLCLHFMEGNPNPDHPLRGNVAAITFACAELYAIAVGASRLLLKNPDPELTGYYSELGFGVAYSDHGTRYCGRDL